MDVLCYLPKKEDEGDGGNNLGTKDGSDDESKDGEHVEHGVGGDGGDSSRDEVVINDSGIFMHRPWGLKGLVLWMRVHWAMDPIMFNTVPS